MKAAMYRHELRRGDEIIATARAIEPTLGEIERRLDVQFLAPALDP